MTPPTKNKEQFTAGAMRAAEKIRESVNARNINSEASPRVAELAAIIDQETALPELVKALEYYRDNHFEFAAVAIAALSKANGE